MPSNSRKSNKRSLIETSLDALGNPVSLSEAARASENVKLARIEAKRNKMTLNHQLVLEQHHRQKESDRLLVEHERIATHERIEMARIREESACKEWVEAMRLRLFADHGLLASAHLPQFDFGAGASSSTSLPSTSLPSLPSTSLPSLPFPSDDWEMPGPGAPAP